MQANQYEKKLERLGAFGIASKMLNLAKNNENHKSLIKEYDDKMKLSLKASD